MDNRTPEERFWNFVEKLSGRDACWIWIGSKFPSGYGCFSLRGKTIKASRASWILNKGKIPRDHCVLHRCDVRDCIRPSHLFTGTNRTNIRDRDQKDRQAKGETNGQAKINASEVVEIRRMYASGEWSSVRLGKYFEMSSRNIMQIVRGIAWKHIPDPQAKLNKSLSYDTGELHHSHRNPSNVRRGSASHYAKLNEHVVEMIRIQASAGAPPGMLAEMFDVSAATISRIVARKIWKHVS